MGTGRVDVQVQLPRVQVNVEPVEISVVIGASLFGGLVEFHIDPSVLPIARLQQSGWVTVRVEGPPAVLPQAEAELQGALSSQGVMVQGFARVAVPDASAVRAVFTVWPPGTRPR